MTVPEIGNYGINMADVESTKPHVEGFVVRERSAISSNYRSESELDKYLAKNGIIGIEGVDTRALTRHIRDKGAMRGVISTTEHDPERLVEKALASPGLIGRDLVKEVTCKQPYEWTETIDDEWKSPLVAASKGKAKPKSKKLKVVVIDCGVKQNILRQLVAHGCGVTVVPASTSSDDILKYKPTGVLVSNGPGDPEGVPYVVETVQKLIGKLPVFGICLGHQIMGLAFNGKTYKLKFGHRGGNQPVMDLKTGRVEITAQNHGFAVDMKSIKNKSIELTHVNLNDKTCEGFKHKNLPAFSVQYHPEASPGPHDAAYLFDRFVDLML
jgi:carbamoyl-phosphate synthase small subunit